MFFHFWKQWSCRWHSRLAEYAVSFLQWPYKKGYCRERVKIFWAYSGYIFGDIILPWFKSQCLLQQTWMVAFLRHSGILFKKIINDGTLARRNDSLVLSIEIVLFPSPGKGHLILLWTRDIGEICWWFSGTKFALQWGERDNWKKKWSPFLAIQ